jgi:hypothetical protein
VGGGLVLKDNGPPRASPLVIAEADRYSSTRISATAASESALKRFQLCPQGVDLNEEWEIRKIVGDEEIGGVPYYLVDWCPSLEPKDSMDYAMAEGEIGEIICGKVDNLAC